MSLLSAKTKQMDHELTYFAKENIKLPKLPAFDELVPVLYCINSNYAKIIYILKVC